MAKLVFTFRILRINYSVSDSFFNNVEYQMSLALHEIRQSGVFFVPMLNLFAQAIFRVIQFLFTVISVDFTMNTLEIYAFNTQKAYSSLNVLFGARIQFSQHYVPLTKHVRENNTDNYTYFRSPVMCSSTSPKQLVLIRIYCQLATSVSYKQ